MLAPKTNKVLEVFNQQVELSYSLIKSVGLVKEAYSKCQPKLSHSDLLQVIELSFVKIFLAWEQFLEDTFVRYMIGVRGKNKVKSYLKPKSLNHAFEILKEGKPFPDWTNIDGILRKANIYFKEGEPYRSNLNLIKSELEDMKFIRNAIVHMSGIAEEKFKSVVRSNIGTFPRGMTPGKFLYSIKSQRPKITYLEFYIDKLKLIAERIVK